MDADGHHVDGGVGQVLVGPHHPAVCGRDLAGRRLPRARRPGVTPPTRGCCGTAVGGARRTERAVRGSACVRGMHCMASAARRRLECACHAPGEALQTLGSEVTGRRCTCRMRAANCQSRNEASISWICKLQAAAGVLPQRTLGRSCGPAHLFVGLGGFVASDVDDGAALRVHRCPVLDSTHKV